ncbi:MAG TPA: multicopper oxidase domain-containing protein [Polyangiaceae bacterium]|nr:multicopper oxidase domain-containing protein [Polyangiaceae bacterium]
MTVTAAVSAAEKDWNEANDGGTVPLAKPANNPPADAYLLPKTLMTPSVLDSGWKDTVMAPPDHVTRIRVRWTPQDKTTFPFDATQGPGYVWHCHMLEHEDNEMMRPLVVVK